MADTTNKVNQVKLKKNGQTVYPQTVTDAVAYVSDDGNTVKKLTTAVDEKLDTAEAEITYVKAEEVTSWTETDESSETQRTYTEALNELQEKVATNTTNISANSKAITEEVSRAKGAEGTLSDLTTTEKGSLVGAVNEVKSTADETKQTVEGYFTEKKLFWDVVDERDLVLRTTEKHLNADTLKWEALTDYTMRDVMVFRLRGAKSVRIGLAIAADSDVYLCKNFDSNGDPVDCIKISISSLYTDADCEDYNYVIINDRKKSSYRLNYGNSIYGSYYDWVYGLYLQVEMTQAEYDAQAPRDNTDTCAFITKWMIEKTMIYPNAITNQSNDSSFKGIIGTRARNISLYSNYPNDDANSANIAVATNPRMETLYIQTLRGWPKLNLNFSLKEVQIVDTSKVSNFNLTFINDVSLTEIDVSSWDVSNVTNMSNMFNGCRTLTEINVGSWDVSNVTNMSGMFNGCRALTEIDVSSWDVSNVTDMGNMFYICWALTEINVGSWDVSNVTNMSNMFNGCRTLTEINVGSWDVSNVTNMSNMFNICQALTEIDVSSWDVSNVTDMSNMFNGCQALTEINVGSWDMQNVSSATYMFYTCSLLTTITGTMQNIKVSISLSNSPLTRESALVVINGLADLTGGTAQTLTLSSTTKALLTEEDKNLITSKNWSLA